MHNISNNKNELQINNEINDKEIRLIGADGTMLGIVSTSEALEMAFQKNLDLVKISPNAVPPVCKIVDYNKAMYEKAKKEKEAKKSQKLVTLKEVRLSAKIEEHDLDFKVKNAYKFLSEGNKVKASIRFKGRQQKYTDDGYEVLSKFAESLKEVGAIDKAPLLEGRVMSIILSPQKP
ncbi:translation initiation factor IF-3 [Sinanaerobacter chloroacetimidivorans]|uniref:Translation initiation factor IF-3 n=1 Tax=Sinanaerobacter chloroacetimidivorans TaxID=2818044 RepID=A0A8J7W601_9FIRM|nr:translation initiation factor IF-3 [Sinanaerobacter chloroacetimidivorans]MBR0599820.1 translation initiation factor IF-3 [Sinanaerobacter chloroacetimidivorans]